MKVHALAFISAMLVAVAPRTAIAATSPADPVSVLDQMRAQEQRGWDGQLDRVITRGGVVEFKWNGGLLADFGLTGRDGVLPSSTRLALSEASRLEIDAIAHSVRFLAGGDAVLDGQIELYLGRTPVVVETPRMIVRAGEELRIDLAGRDGEVPFYIDRVMFQFIDGDKKFRIRSADLRIASALAHRIGRPDAVDIAIAEVRLVADVSVRVSGRSPLACGDPNWPGEPAVGGGQYAADVFMQGFTGQVSRCRATISGGACDGPAGATDGDIVYTPSSTLINNIANGGIVATIVGDPLGSSTAPHAADVRWIEKFSGNVEPYNNDQHPYLIWNLYRTDASGGFTQIGRSGVKHAFLTTNVGTDCEGCNGNFVLGRACVDTYGTGNNDGFFDLGPRSEILPSSGQWGRCGSVYDVNCDGTCDGTLCQEFGPGVGAQQFERRMLVKESSVEPASNPGATFLVESWYIVREDINIYNTMATRPLTLAWNGASWSAIHGSPFRLGAAIDRWIDAASASGAITRIAELSVPEGHAKVAVRVDDLGGGSWRYRYTVMNFDFARGATSGAEPNLRVLRNNGFNRFTVSIDDPTASISQVAYADGDLDRADWSAAVSNAAVEWVAPSAAASQNWGVMASFSFVANKAPVQGTIDIGVTEPGTPSSYAVGAFRVGQVPVGPGDNILRDSFEDPVAP